MSFFMMSSALAALEQEKGDLESHRRRRPGTTSSASASSGSGAPYARARADYGADERRAMLNSDATEVFVESAIQAAARRAAEAAAAAAAGDPASGSARAGGDAAADGVDAAIAKAAAAASRRAHAGNSVRFVGVQEMARRKAAKSSMMFKAAAMRDDADAFWDESSCSDDEEVARLEDEHGNADADTVRLHSASSVPPRDALSEAFGPESAASEAAAPRPRRRPRDTCFLCTHGDRNYDAMYAPAVKRCRELIEENIGHCNLYYLARQVHKHFKHNIYLPQRRAGRRVPMWRSRSVYEHITRHELDPRIYVAVRIYSLRAVLESLDDCLFYTHPDTGERVPHKDNLKAAKDVHAQLDRLYAMNVAKANFYDPSAQYDPGARTKNAFEGALTGVRVHDAAPTAVFTRRQN